MLRVIKNALCAKTHTHTQKTKFFYIFGKKIVWSRNVDKTLFDYVGDVAYSILLSLKYIHSNMCAKMNGLMDGRCEKMRKKNEGK